MTPDLGEEILRVVTPSVVGLRRQIRVFRRGDAMHMYVDICVNRVKIMMADRTGTFREDLIEDFIIQSETEIRRALMGGYYQTLRALGAEGHHRVTEITVTGFDNPYGARTLRRMALEELVDSPLIEDGAQWKATHHDDKPHQVSTHIIIMRSAGELDWRLDEVTPEDFYAEEKIRLAERIVADDPDLYASELDFLRRLEGEECD